MSLAVLKFMGPRSGTAAYADIFDDFESYTDAASLNTLNGGVQWKVAWVSRNSPFGYADTLDTFESYTDADNIFGLNGGTGWNTIWTSFVAAPVISSSSQTSPTTITITCATGGASIYYTTDGTTPTTSSTLYTGTFSLSVKTTIKAIASYLSKYSDITTRIVLVTPPTSGMLVQWEATSITASDGDAIATWPDISVNARDATQATGANKPLYKINIFENRPALLFDGSNDFFNFTAAAVSSFTVHQVYLPSTSDYHAATLTWCPPSGDRSGFALNGQNKHCTTFNSSGSETNNKVMATALTGGTKHVLTWTYNGTTLVSRDNGAGQSNSSVDAGYGNTNSLGQSYQYFTGYIAAIIVYNRVLTSGEIDDSEAYLNAKYPCY